MRAAELRHVVARVSGRRTRRLTEELWRIARRGDTPAACRTAEAAAAALRSAGLTDVRIEDVPADGATVCGGWIMPPAWTLQDAVLTSVAPPSERVLFADASRIPQALAVQSPPTAHQGWIAGPALDCGAFATKADDVGAWVGRHRRRLAGCFLVMKSDAVTAALNARVAGLGAQGIIVVSPGTLKGCRYLNYAVPLDLSRPAVPVFSLSPTAARLLHRAMKDPALRLRARVRTRREAGTVPMLTGSIGVGAPAIYLCAHLDEIGAQDNASGCAVAVEALRLLQAAGTKPQLTPQRRQIVFFFSSEVRGQQWWFNHRDTPSRYLSGLNLDMVGADPQRESDQMQLLTGFGHHPHFAGPLLLKAAGVADAVVGKMPTSSRASYVSDAVPGVHGTGGHVSLEQRPGPSYHSSADTPRVLSEQALRWSGVAATAFLYHMTRLDNRDIIALARRTIRDLERASGRERARLTHELRSLQAALVGHDLYPDLQRPEDFHAAGVNSNSGCWPEIEDRERFRTLTKPWVRPADSATRPQSATPLIPLRLFNGFLSFEDRITARGAGQLQRELGLRPGWGTESWAWMLASCCNGKQTLEEILASLAELGIAIEAERAEALIHYLVRRRLMRLRPVLDKASLRRLLEQAGVRLGSVLMVHSSLSRFGYILGGAGTVVEALLEAVGPEGTLVMPTHSNSVLGNLPYVRHSSPSNTGAVTEYFRRFPGVVRSAHPTHSVAALGPQARQLTDPHRVDMAPLAREGFWGQLYALDGHILLMCPLTSATVFHVGETWTGLPQRTLVAHAVDSRGRRRVYELPNAPWHVGHFPDSMAEPLLRSGRMRRLAFGESHVYVSTARAMSDSSVAAISADPTLCLGRQGACQCPNCRVLRVGLQSRTER